MKTVSIKHTYWDIAADIYFPDDFNSEKKYPAIISAHPIGSCKEQTSGSVYGAALAKAGFIVIAFNASFQGSSGGEPRYLEDPTMRVKDFSIVVDYLTTLPYVDAGFYYHGPRDNRERYYRVSFREVPTRNLTKRSPSGGEVSTEPVVVMDTILVVRPRQVQFKWSFDQVTGTVSNTGNTWFKLLIKPGCDSTEEEGDAWYLRPGDVVHQPELRQPGNHYLVYNDKFIKISDSCPAKPPSAD
ncbi:TPA: alpha/beta hydrolase [Escherichia coli]